MDFFIKSEDNVYLTCVAIFLSENVIYFFYYKYKLTHIFNVLN